MSGREIDDAKLKTFSANSATNAPMATELQKFVEVHAEGSRGTTERGGQNASHLDNIRGKFTAAITVNFDRSERGRRHIKGRYEDVVEEPQARAMTICLTEHNRSVKADRRVSRSRDAYQKRKQGSVFKTQALTDPTVAPSRYVFCSTDIAVWRVQRSLHASPGRFRECLHL